MMTLSEWMKIVEGTQAMHDVSKRFGLGQPADRVGLQRRQNLTGGLRPGRGGHGRSPLLGRPRARRSRATQLAKLFDQSAGHLVSLASRRPM